MTMRPWDMRSHIPWTENSTKSISMTEKATENFVILPDRNKTEITQNKELKEQNSDFFSGSV